MVQSQSLVPSQTNNQEEEEEEEEVEVEVEEQRLIYQQYEDLVSALPSVEGCTVTALRFHDGWYSVPSALVSANVARKLFEAKPDDILLATFPKSGTTWLKALLFATVNRNNLPDQRFSSSRSTLSRLNPHECVPSLEHQLYINNKVPNYLGSLPSPRLFGTHIPFHALPNSVTDSKCRIVYLCRDPKDTFVSLWHFVNKLRKTHNLEPVAIEVSFDHFCKGLSPFGPYSNHVLGYWNASLEGGHGRPNIMFMVYEKLMEDPITELKRLAEFVGCPFTSDEDEDGVAEGIVRMCGFDNLSNLEVNKTGTMEITLAAFQNHMLFRRGVVGDWMNHLTPQMARDLDEIVKTKLEGSGLIL